MIDLHLAHSTPKPHTTNAPVLVGVAVRVAVAAAAALVVGPVVVAEDEEERHVEDDADDGDDHHEEAVDGDGGALEPACWLDAGVELSLVCGSRGAGRVYTTGSKPLNRHSLTMRRMPS